MRTSNFTLNSLYATTALVIASVSFAPAAMAASNQPFTTVTTTSTDDYLAASSTSFSVTGAGNVTSAGVSAVKNTNQAVPTLTVNTTSTTDGIASTGDFSAVKVTGTGTIGTITVTSGTISSAATTAGLATIQLSGTTTATTIIGIAATGTVINTQAGGEAIAITGTGANTVNLTNAGVITAGTGGGAFDFSGATNAVGTVTNQVAGNITGAILAGANHVTVTNNTTSNGITGAISATTGDLDVVNTLGAIAGNINLGTNAGSTVALNGGTDTGTITFGDAAQSLTFNGGTLAGNIIAATTGSGDINVTASTVTNGNIGTNSNQLDDVTINNATTFNLATNNNDLYVDNVVLNGASATLTLGTGAIDATINGGAAGQGILNLNGNNTLKGNIGGVSTGLATINIGTGVAINDQTNDSAITATNLFIGSGSTLSLGTGVVTGAIKGATNGVGTLTFTEGQTTAGVLGATGNSLLAVNVTGGVVTLGSGSNINATTTTISSGATLNLGNTATTVTGAIADSSAGTLGLGTATHTLSNNLTLGATSITTVAMTSGTNDASGKIASSGTVAITNGATISAITGGAGYIGRGTTYTIITGTNAGVGTLNILDDSTDAGLSFAKDTTAGANILRLVAVRTSDFSTSAATGGGDVNSQRAGQALEGVAAPTGTLALFINRIDAAVTANNNAAVASALEEVTPEADSAATNIANNVTKTISDILSNRVRTGMKGIASGDAMANKNVWVQTFGTLANQGNIDGTTGYDAQTYGFAVGVDKDINENNKLGVSITYANSQVDSNDSLKSTDADTYQANIYGGTDLGKGIFIDGNLGYAYNDFSTDRRITTPAVTANGDFTGNTYSAKVTAGMDKALDQGFVLTPNIGVLAAYTTFEKYTESGAGGLDLTVDNDNSTYVLGRAGVNVNHITKLDNGTQIIPQVSVAYLYDIVNDGQATTSNFTGGGTTFKTDGAKQSPGGAALGVGVNVVTTGNLTISGDYNLEYREDYTANSAILRAKYAF